MANDSHFEVYPDQEGDWRWRLRASNGEIVADSAEGYEERIEAYHAIGRLVAILSASPEPIIELAEGFSSR